MTDLLQPNGDQPLVDESKKYFEELVGEGKRYADPEALAKKAVHADATIEILKRRLDEQAEYTKKLHEENVTKAKLEELYEKLSTQGNSNSDTTPAKESPTSFKPEDIENIVSKKLEQAKLADQETKNLDTVKAKLIEKFGTNYQTQVNQQITQLGLSSADFHDLAKKSPSALIKALGLDQTKSDGFQAPFTSAQRNDNFAPTGAKKRTWSYYQELKKSNPQLYFDRNTAVQMTKDAIELGDAFRDGNYFVRGLHDN